MPVPLLFPSRESGRRFGTLRHGLFSRVGWTVEIDPKNGNKKIPVKVDDTENDITSGDCFVLKVPDAPGVGNEKPKEGKLLDHGRLYKTRYGLGMSGKILQSIYLRDQAWITPLCAWLYVAKGVSGTKPAEIWLASLCYAKPPLEAKLGREVRWFVCLERFGVFSHDSARRYYIAITDKQPDSKVKDGFLLDISEDGATTLFQIPDARWGWENNVAMLFYHSFTLAGSGASIRATYQKHSFAIEKKDRVNIDEGSSTYLLQQQVTTWQTTGGGNSTEQCPCLTWSLSAEESSTDKYCKEGYWNWSQVDRQPFIHTFNTTKVTTTVKLSVNRQTITAGSYLDFPDNDHPDGGEEMTSATFNVSVIKGWWPCEGVGAIIPLGNGSVPVTLADANGKIYGKRDSVWLSSSRRYGDIEETKTPFSATLLDGKVTPVYMIEEVSSLSSSSYRAETEDTPISRGTDATIGYPVGHNYNLVPGPDGIHPAQLLRTMKYSGGGVWTKSVGGTGSGNDTYKKRWGIEISNKTFWMHEQKRVRGGGTIRYYVDNEEVKSNKDYPEVEELRANNEGFGLRLEGTYHGKSGVFARVVSRKLTGDTQWKAIGYGSGPVSFFAANPDTRTPEYHTDPRYPQYPNPISPCYV